MEIDACFHPGDDFRVCCNTLSRALIMLYLSGGMAIRTLKNSVFVMIGRTLYVAPVFQVVVCVGLMVIVNGS